jgi:hypothetical protein
VAGVSTSNIKAKELNGPLAGLACECGRWRRTNGSGSGDGKDSNKSRRASVTGNECLGIGRLIAVECQVGGRDNHEGGSQRGTSGGSEEGRHCQDGGWEEKSVLIHERLDNGGVGGFGTTPDLLLGKVMRAHSGSCCKRCTITLTRRGRRGDSDIDNIII